MATLAVDVVDLTSERCDWLFRVNVASSSLAVQRLFAASEHFVGASCPNA